MNDKVVYSQNILPYLGKVKSAQNCCYKIPI